MYHEKMQGTHYEAGYAYGQCLKQRGVVITESPTFGITEEMKQHAAHCAEAYGQYYPEILQEIRGMADGQGSSFDRLTQILFSMYCFKPDHHCTCFAVSNGEEIVMGRNSDFLVSIENLYMNCLYELEGAYAFNGNTTAFIEMEDGINEYGLAIGLTFLYPHIRKPGLNAGMLLRYILEKCKTTEEAIQALNTLPIASAQTFTIADSFGSIAVAECNPALLEVIYPQPDEPFVAATNQFYSDTLHRYKNPPGIDDWRAEERYHTVKTALKTHQNKALIPFAKKLLSGQYGFICQYDRQKNADTVWSVIYDLKRCQIYRAEGNPSRIPYEEDKRMSFRL